MRRPVVMLIAFLALTLGLGSMLYYLTLMRGTLGGQRVQDFGTVELVNGMVKLEHTFHLTNRTERMVKIREVRADCGCTKAEAAPATVEPGAAVDIQTVTEFSARGYKQVVLRVIFDDGSMQMLYVRATGKPVKREMPPPNEPNSVLRWTPVPPRKSLDFEGARTGVPTMEPDTQPFDPNLPREIPPG